MIWQWKQDGIVKGKDAYLDCASFIRKLSRQGMPQLAQEILLEMNSEGFLPTSSTLVAFMLCYIENGLFPQAQAIWEELLEASCIPNTLEISELINAYCKTGRYDEVTRILDDICSRNISGLYEVFSVTISCFGERGELELMESTLKKMASSGLPVDSVTGNSIIKYYSIFGSMAEMEAAYGRLKRSRLLIEEEGIRAMSFAYIRENDFYRLGEFLRDVGLGRRNVGNLLWNILLLSYAANFKMKSMQREFLRMVEAGFNPDLTTFNIRALAFSRMSMFWDLHLSLEHMRCDKVVPDLVTYGCVVDAYLTRKLGRNLDFAVSKLNPDNTPQILTDSIVFEVLGKGEFHSTSEAFLEFKGQKRWTYRELIAVYLKKKYRKNQIFWNY